MYRDIGDPKHACTPPYDGTEPMILYSNVFNLCISELRTQNSEIYST